MQKLSPPNLPASQIEELPEILPQPGKDMVRAGIPLLTLPSSSAECAFWKGKIKLDLPTSTWLALSAKGIKVGIFISVGFLVDLGWIAWSCSHNGVPALIPVIPYSVQKET